MYKSPEKDIWSGRKDNSDKELWHQVIEMLDMSMSVSGGPGRVVFLGFASDEGVRRNQGRIGAKDGPDAIRKAMCNLAVHFNPDQLSLFDAGNVATEGENLEEGHQELAEKVKILLDAGYFPILLGGGHEIAYGHYCGIRSHLGNSIKIGIINFDAHFDLRSYKQGPHSGSPFRQVLDDCRNQGAEFHYFPVGISKASNTKSLFSVMEAHNQEYILAEEIKNDNSTHKIKAFIDQMDQIYVTLDLDVMASGFVSGVSAPAPFGFTPNQVRDLLRFVFTSQKVISMDIAELNPAYDDGRSAKIAASFVYEAVMYFSYSLSQ